MFQTRTRRVLWTAFAVASLQSAAMAQPDVGGDLIALHPTQLDSELTMRFNAALAATQDPAVVSADDNRFMWASQAKAQCGIAKGFLRSGAKDPVSVSKCADAFNRMRAAV